MNTLWHKIWFDVWQNKSRSLLVIINIAVGVFALGSIFGMMDQLLSSMDAAHRLVAPSHISIILRTPVDDQIIEALKSIPNVVDIDPVNQLTVRYKLNPDDDWKLGTLHERPDFSQQTFDLVELKDGEWPVDGQIGIERLSSQYYQVGIGDAVIFDVNGRAEIFSVNGKIRHPFVQPPLFGGQANFFISAADLEKFGVPQGLYGQLLVQVTPYSDEMARQVASQIRSELAQQGKSVVVTLYQEPDRHWGRMFVEGVNLVLRVMAFVALFISVVLVLNTMTAVITQQTSQIGVIKAIGGRRATLILVYLAQVLIFGLIALLIALPLSTVFTFLMTRWFLNLFNIDYPSIQVSASTIALLIGGALLAPVLSALWPVLRGSRISVREAIASYGIGADFGNGRFDNWIETFAGRFLTTVYATALGNIFRRKGRLALTVLVIVVSGVMFLAVMSLISSINLTLDNETNRQAYDIRVGFTQSQPIQKVTALADSVTGVEESEAWLSLNATLLRQGERLEDSAGLGAQLIGMPADSTMYRPIITNGRWLRPDDTEQVIVISQETAEINGIQVGDTVGLDLGAAGSAEWRVIGAYRAIYTNGFLVEPIYAPLSALAKMTGLEDQASQLLVKGNVQNLVQETDLAKRLESALEAEQIKLDFYTTSTRLDQRSYADNQFKTVTITLLNLALLMAIVGGVGLMGSLGISVIERKREIGIMRSIGARSFHLRGLFTMEGVLQALISYIISVPIAYLIGRPFAISLGQTMLDANLDYAFNLASVGMWLGAVLVISIVFSILPGKHSTQISVRESLEYS